MKKALFSALFLACFFGLQKCEAVSYEYQDFDAFSPGETWNSFVATTTAFYSSPNSGSWQNTSVIPFSSTATTTIFSFYFKGIFNEMIVRDGPNVNANLDVVGPLPGHPQSQLRIISNGSIVWQDDYAYNTTTFAKFEFHLSPQDLTAEAIINGTSTGWFDLAYNTIGNIEFWPKGTPEYIDDFIYLNDETPAEEVPFITSFDETEFFPQYPLDCQFNIVDYSTTSLTFALVGHFTNAPSSTITYDDLRAYFYTASSTSEGTSTALCATSEPNSDCAWAKAVILPLERYRIEYVAKGYDQNGRPFVYRHYCPNTGVGTSTPTGAIDWWGTRANICTFPDCSSLGWWDSLERLWCESENFGLRLICPEPEVLDKSMAILDSLKSKFPYNYMKATKDIFDEGASLASSTASTTLLGEDIADFQSTALYLKGLANVGSVNIFNIFYLAVSGLLLIAFGYFIIKIIGKEFFT